MINPIIDPNLRFNEPLVRRTSTEFLVLHHAAKTTASVEDVHRWHIGNGWAGIGYNFYIRKDGKIYKGRGWEYIGAHINGYNMPSIGICFEGDYDRADTSMPNAQRLAGANMIAEARHRYPSIGAVYGHRDLRSSECPGRYFPFDAVVKGGSVSPSFSPLTLDGVFGRKSVEALQRYTLTAQDGVISDQHPSLAYCRPALTSVTSGTAGSTTIRELQRRLGVGADGQFGPATIKALQQKMLGMKGNSVDGHFGAISAKAFQDFLNKQLGARSIT